MIAYYQFLIQTCGFIYLGFRAFIAEGTNGLLYLVLLVDADRSLLPEGSKLNL